MRRLLLFAAAIGIGLAPVAAAAQSTPSVRPPRSQDYLFTATATDARSLWVNPAGLGIMTEASIMGELALDRLTSDSSNLGVGQYTVGFDSHGIAFGFRHDFYADTSGVNVFRVGAGRAVGRLALGASFTFYKEGRTQREAAFGARVLLARGLETSATIEHIGRPLIRGAFLNPAGILGLAWTVPIAGRITLAAEARAEDRSGTSGYDVSYRGGLTYQTPGRIPVGLLVSADLDNTLHANRVVFGLSIGGVSRGVAVGSAVKDAAGMTQLTTMSLTGVATAVRPSGRGGQ